MWCYIKRLLFKLGRYQFLLGYAPVRLYFSACQTEIIISYHVSESVVAVVTKIKHVQRTKMNSREHHSLPLQPSGKQNTEEEREVRSLPCKLNVAETKGGQVRQCLSDGVSQIVGIQGPTRDGNRASRCTNECDFREKENATKQKIKHQKPIQAARGLQDNRVDRSPEVSRNRILSSHSTGSSGEPEQAGTNQTRNATGHYAGSSGEPEQTGTNHTGNAPDHLASSESDNNAGLQQSSGNRRPPMPLVSPDSLFDGTRGTSMPKTVSPNRYRKTRTDVEGSRGECPATHNGNHNSFQLPPPLSCRQPPTQNGRPLVCQESDRHYEKTRIDLEESNCRPCRPGEYMHRNHSHLKNAGGTGKLCSERTLTTSTNSANKLWDFHKDDPLDSIPPLDSVSWTSAGECSDDEDRDKSILKQHLNNTLKPSLKTPVEEAGVYALHRNDNTASSDYSEELDLRSDPPSSIQEGESGTRDPETGERHAAAEEANISQCVEESGVSTYHSNDYVTSSEGSEEVNLRSDPPQGQIHHEGEIDTVHSVTETKKVLGRGRRTSAGKSSADETYQDMEQTALKQRLNTTSVDTLQYSATPCSDVTVSQPAEETRTADLPSNGHATSSEDRRGPDLCSDPPRQRQHEDEIAIVDRVTDRQAVVERGSRTSVGGFCTNEIDLDRGQTPSQQYLNTTTEVTLQSPPTPYSDDTNSSPPVQETPCSDDTNVSPPVQETGTSALNNNQHVTSPGNSRELDLYPGQPSIGVQHALGFVTLHPEARRQSLADRGQASILPKQSRLSMFPLCQLNYEL